RNYFRRLWGSHLRLCVARQGRRSDRREEASSPLAGSVVDERARGRDGDSPISGGPFDTSPSGRRTKKRRLGAARWWLLPVRTERSSPPTPTCLSPWRVRQASSGASGTTPRRHPSRWIRRLGRLRRPPTGRVKCPRFGGRLTACAISSAVGSSRS